MMRRFRIAAAAALCSLAAIAAGTKTRVATQEWVAERLSAAGVRISMAVVSTNVVAGVTNIVVTSPYTCPEVPECQSVRFTMTPAELNMGDADVDHSRPYVSVTIVSGQFFDGSTWFQFAKEWVLEANVSMPDPMPTGTHRCQLGADCICVEAGNTRESVEEELPDEYKDMTFEDAAKKYPTPLSLVDTDTWGDETWQTSLTIGGRTTYFARAIVDGGGERSFNVEKFGESDAWLECIQDLAKQENKYRKILRDFYIDEHVCDKMEPQHSETTITCGSFSWKECGRCGTHISGTEQHEYPGTVYTADGHKCVCGRGEIEPHGTLELTGSKTYTYSGSVKTGWTGTLACPKGCGYTKQTTHVCHHTNCGVCDAGDGCDEPCHCEGNHVWGNATQTECAKCECPACTDCAANPPDTDMTKHSGWQPCREDVEEDNDDGRAAGAHCQCQCLTYGHNAETPHDYRLAAGLKEYEPYNDESHYQRFGQCSRCLQWKKKLRPHTYDSTPFEYDYVSPSICRYKYKCTADGCGHTRNDDTHGHTLGNEVEAYVNVSPSICRYLKKCEKGHYVPDDSHGHVRNVADECKCQNGCGYQFEHDWKTSACGNEECSLCHKSRYGQSSHSGWDNNAGTAAGHKCACGRETLQHTFGAPTVVAREGWIVTYRETCSVCTFSHEYTADTNPCKNGHVLNTNSSTCECLCGYYSPTNQVAQAENLHNFADTKDADGVQTCTCKCGRYHVQRAWSSYRANLPETVGSTNVCGNVCSYCKEKAGTGLDIGRADDSLHTPREHSTCGCKCGRLTAEGTNLEKFHIQKPGTCICYGSDGNGGSWHFRHPKEGCPGVCAYTPNRLYSGAEHCVALAAKEHATPAMATPSDHTKVESGRCGCKCGSYNNLNHADWTQHANLHNSKPYYCGCWCGHAGTGQISPYHKKADDSQCKCQCGATVVSHSYAPGDCRCHCKGEHKRIDRQDGKCPGVCHGPCGEYAEAALKGRHTPDPLGCGCECGTFSGSAYSDLRFHSGHGSPSCTCTCGKYHNHSEARTDCTQICKFCDDGKSNLAHVDPITYAPVTSHYFGPNSCVCACGKHTKHRFAADACDCYCHATSRPHIWEIDETDSSDSYTCPTCGNTITQYRTTYMCSRCGESEEGYSESGHAADCGHREESESYDPCACGCLGCSCKACRENKGLCTTCGRTCKPEEDEEDSDGGSGGETGGTGGLDDI